MSISDNPSALNMKQLIGSSSHVVWVSVVEPWLLISGLSFLQLGNRQFIPQGEG